MGTTRPVRPGWRADSRIDLGPVGRLGRGCRPCRPRAPPWPPTGRTGRARRASRAAASALAATKRRQLVEDAGDLLGLGDLRLAPGVAQLDRDERLDEQRLAAARRVVDDALDPRPRLGLDRDHVAAVAQRDDRLLERAPELRADERVEPAAQPVVGDPDGRAQAAEARRGGVEQLARPGRSCERAWTAAAGSAWSSRPRSRSSGRRSSARSVPEPGGRVERLGDLEELGRFEPAAAGRPLDRPARCRAAAPIPTPGPLLEKRARLVGLVEAARDDDRVVRRLEGLGQAARRRERGRLGQPRPDGRELEQRERARVHRRGGRSARPAWRSRRRTAARARRSATAGRSTARPRRRRRSGPSPRSPAPARSPARVSRRSGDAGSHRSTPVQPRVEPERRRDEPRARSPAVRRAAMRSRSASAAAALGRQRPSPRGRADDAVDPHRVDPLERLDGADEHARRACRRVRSPRSGSRTSRRQGTRRRCPAGPNMTRFRAVSPNRAWDARSSGPR